MASVNMGNNHSETPLVREGSSVFALTFDEFHQALGDHGADFGSMNMDEFLRNIWTAEESQAMAAAINPSNGGLATQISLQRQESLCLPRTLSTKTVEEVWKSLQPQQETMASVGAGGGQQQRQITLGEVTLEDFLLKAGIVKEAPPSNPSPRSCQENGVFPGQDNGARYNTSCNGSTFPLLIPSSGGGPSSMDIMQQDCSQAMLPPVHTPTQQGDWMVNPYKKPLSQRQQHATEQILHRPAMIEAAPPYSNVTNGARSEASPVAGVVGKGGLDISFGGGIYFNELGCGAASPPDESNADTSNLLTSPYGIFAQPGRKRCAEGPIEKVIQRRQRRMIKNRESAARSRARKQAYTVELEAEVSQLKEENTKLLRKQEHEAELRKKQILAVIPSSVLKESCALKRTHTGPW